jgi:hypothetical protein
MAGQLLNGLKKKLKDTLDNFQGGRLGQAAQKLNQGVTRAGQAMETFGYKTIPQKVAQSNYRMPVTSLPDAILSSRPVRNFAAQAVGGTIGDIGQTVKNVSTPEGRQILLRSAKNVPTQVKNRDFGGLLDNPALIALTAAPDISDIGKVGTRQVAKKLLKEGVGDVAGKTVKKVTQAVLPTKGIQTTRPAEEVLKVGTKQMDLKPVSAARRTPQELSQIPQTQGKSVEQPLQASDQIIADAKKQIGEPPKPKYETLKESLDKFYTQWVDRFHPVVKTADYVEKKVGLKTENNPKYLVRRLTGATGIADARVRREFEPILEEATKLGIDKSDLDVYMANRRLAGFGKIGREVFGADPAKSQAVVDALNTKYGGNIGQVAEKLYQYQDKGLNEMVEAGFITPEAATAMRGQNPDYAPLQRVMDEVDNYLGLPTRKLMQGSQPMLKLKGSERQILSPLDSIMQNTFKQRAAIEKNRVARSIAGLGELAPELGFKKVSASGNDTITVWNGGQKEYWQVGTEIADTAKGLNEENMNSLLKLFTGPASLLRQGATGRNPEFMIPNIVRDQLDAGISSKYGYIPFIDYLSGLFEVGKNELNQTFGFKLDDSIYRMWENSGAKIDLGSMSGGKTVAEATSKKSMFNIVGEILDTLGLYSEQPTRVGLFKKAYKKTGDELIAAMESRDATVDFARMGSKMKVANSIIPFLNVGVQGFDKLIRAVKAQPMKVALNATIYGTLPAVTTTLYNLTQHPEEYAEIPQYDKDSNFIIVKGRNENGTVDYVTIPKGNILPVIANPIQSFLEFARGQSQQKFSEFATQFISSTLPVIGDGQSLPEVGLKTIGSNLPQLVKPVAENLLNKSFYKYDTKKEQSKEIVPSYLQKKEPYQQSYEFTPELYQKIGQALNVSPLKAQNLIEGYLAGYAKLPANVIDILSRGDDTNKRPILRRFIKQTYPTSEKKPTSTKTQDVKKTEKETSGIMDRLSDKASAAEKPQQIVEYEKSGKTYELDLSKTFEYPTGDKDDLFYKEKLSRFKSGISSQINKVYDAYEDGKLSEDQAREAITNLQKEYDKSKTPKTKKGKKIKLGKPPEMKKVQFKAPARMPGVKFSGSSSPKFKLASPRRRTQKVKLKQLKRPKVKISKKYE